MPQEITKVNQEQAIFQEFEELGYEIKILISQQNENHIQITNEKLDTFIDVYHSHYPNDCWYECSRFETYEPQVIQPQEHQLLHRLFEIWGWFDE